MHESESKQLRSILRLLDDESPRIREKVWDRLAQKIPEWGMALKTAMGDLPEATRRKVEDLLADREREVFRTSWGDWRQLGDDALKLEAALSALSAHISQSPAVVPGLEPSLGPRLPLNALLDGLAKEFQNSGEALKPSGLAHFLFVTKGFRGADSDYYDPRNSDLVNVLETKRGIPISLACIFILIGWRLGFKIWGCDVPEHFLTRAQEDGQDIIIDCFDSGKILERERLSQLERKYAPDFSRILRIPATAESMVARVLRNLINAFHLAGNKEASEYIWSLAEDLREEREKQS